MRALSIRTRRCSLLSCNLQLRRLPRAQAPDQIHDLLEAVSHKQAAGDGRAIAAGAMDDDALVLGNFVEAFGEVIEGDIGAVGNVLVRIFTGAADVEDEGRCVGGELLVQSGGGK